MLSKSLMNTKSNIITQFKNEIFSLQRFKTPLHSAVLDVGLQPIKNAFPGAEFPLGSIHEFLCETIEDVAATNGFIAGITSAFMRNGGVAIWISPTRTIFPPALKSFGISPEKVIFIDLQNEKEILWVIEEALKCDGLSAVIGETRHLSLITSRRLQLAVEKSLVTGFIIRTNRNNINATACTARWRVKHLKTVSENHLPGVGFPRFNIELLKVRNGKPGAWQLEWAAGKFTHISNVAVVIPQQQKKAG